MKKLLLIFGFLFWGIEAAFIEFIRSKLKPYNKPVPQIKTG
jgi:hypothetical protein